MQVYNCSHRIGFAFFVRVRDLFAVLIRYCFLVVGWHFFYPTLFWSGAKGQPQHTHTIALCQLKSNFSYPAHHNSTRYDDDASQKHKTFFPLFVLPSPRVQLIVIKRDAGQGVCARVLRWQHTVVGPVHTYEGSSAKQVTQTLFFPTKPKPIGGTNIFAREKKNKKKKQKQKSSSARSRAMRNRV